MITHVSFIEMKLHCGLVGHFWIRSIRTNSICWKLSKFMLSNEDDKLKNICVIYHFFMENTFRNSKCKLRWHYKIYQWKRVMQNSREINNVNRRHFKNHRRNSSDYCSWKESVVYPFHPGISVHLNIFQIDFHMLECPCCNLNPRDQNKYQSVLSLLKTTKQKEGY